MAKKKTEKPTPQTIEVDGHTFRITVDGDNASYDWLTGKVEGYGFSLAVMGASRFTFPREFHVSQIKQFLADVDPETGLLPDDE